MSRIVTCERKTKETDISITLNLDGTGNNDIHTGIGFFDHMLDGFARHGLFDLTIRVNGDLDVDSHHTIEDTGIVLGNAILKAIGDKVGIKRFGDMILPMDETLALVRGRSVRSVHTFVMMQNLQSRRLVTMDTEMVKEFFYAVSYGAVNESSI